jgi:hypothetical protein
LAWGVRMSDDEFEPEIQALWVKYEEIAMHFNDR